MDKEKDVILEVCRTWLSNTRQKNDFLAMTETDCREILGIVSNLKEQIVDLQTKIEQRDHADRSIDLVQHPREAGL